MIKEHIIRKHPKNKLWYVCGLCGTRQGKPLYMPISQGYNRLIDAQRYIKYVPLAEHIAKTCEL